MAARPERKKGKGALRLWSERIEADLLPQLTDLGFPRDPARAHWDGWNEQAYQWHLFCRPAPDVIAQVTVWAGIARAPQLNVDATLFRLPDQNMTDADAAEWAHVEERNALANHRQSPAHMRSGRLYHDHLSQWSRIGQGSPARLDRVLDLPAIVRYPVAALVWAFHIVSLFVILPALIMDARWMKSDKPRSGKAQRAATLRAKRAAVTWQARLARSARATGPHWRL